MDVNMPEMLVHDLEFSEPIFRAHSMTAGSPSFALSAYKPDHSVRISSQYRQLADQIRGLSTIVEQDTIDESEASADTEGFFIDNFSDSELEKSVSDYSDFHQARKPSVATAATSISGPPSSPLSTQSSSLDQHEIIGWQSERSDHFSDYQPEPESPNLDFGLSAPPLLPSLMVCPDLPIRRTPAPPLRPPSDMDFENGRTSSPGTLYATIDRPRLVHITASPSTPVAIPTRSSSRKALSKLPRFPSIMSMHDGDMTDSQSLDIGYDGRGESSQTLPNNTPAMCDTSGSVGPATSEPRRRHFTAKQLRQREGVKRLSVYAESVPVRDKATIKEQQARHSRVLSEVVANIDHWVDHGVDVHILQSNTPAQVPINSEVVENLRIHVQNFPDTMLTCKSLAFETIRSYSKKVKHLGPSMRDVDYADFALSDSAEAKSGQFLKTVMSVSKRFAGFSRRRSTRSAAQVAEIKRMAMSSPALAPDWTPIKNIFPLGSDYMCEALYAHLVAYNYIKSLCPAGFGHGGPRFPPVFGERPDDPVTGRNDGTKISRKAAHVLGLTTSPSTPTGSTSYSVIMPGTERPPSRSSQTNGRQGTTREMMNELRMGLIKCIGCLVTSVSFTGTAEHRAPTFSQELLRSLSETVRCSEDRMP